MSNLCTAIVAKGICITDFRLYIQSISDLACDYDKDQPKLLDSVKAEIDQAESIHK